MNFNERFLYTIHPRVSPYTMARVARATGSPINRHGHRLSTATAVSAKIVRREPTRGFRATYRQIRRRGFKAAEPTLDGPTRAKSRYGTRRVRTYACAVRRYARCTDLSLRLHPPPFPSSSSSLLLSISLFLAPFLVTFASGKSERYARPNAGSHGGVNDRQFVRADHFSRRPMIICRRNYN